MEFHVLGPLEVVEQGRALSLGGPKQRAVLAVLVLHANEVVPTDRLIDELWGERPPKTAGAYLQNCVSRLRKVLGAGLLETRPPGYVLSVEPELVDARRFERLVREAKGLPTSERATAFHTALALWRGPALADFAFEEFAQSEIGRLEELRLAALEEQLGAELELGLHGEVVGAIEALVARQPTRERLRRLQMLALYRSGRQDDAQNAYQELRLALIEYGIEPSEELRALNRMIVMQDPALDLVPFGRPEQPVVREARKKVALLFGELVLPEGLDPEAERRLSARCLAAAEAVVARHGGTVQQLLGEEIAAVFGVPVAHEDDAFRAVRAGLELREAVERHDVRLRAAIEAGEVIVGDEAPGLGGSTLTAARRLKEEAAVGELLVGPGALRLVGHAVDVVPSGTAFRLLRLVEGAPPVARHLDAPLVGRDEELGRLRGELDEVVRSRTCRRTTVVGDPGIGKSRLAGELLASLGEGVGVLTGRCVPYGEGATYLPLAEALRQAPGRGDPQARIEARLAGLEDAATIAGLLAGVMGASDAVATADETAWAVRRFLESVGRELPVVLLLEDVHWAEAALLDLVEYLVGWTADAPILLVCLARPELLDDRPDWGRDAIVLRPLDVDDARRLVEALPERDAVAAETVEAVLESAEGNPLFLEQLVALASEGLLGVVPPTVEALLASRLDRLDPAERAVLERAAVAGREFWRGAVDELSPGDERGSVGVRLMALARRRLVHPDRSTLSGEDGFRFHHALIRDVAYAGIPKATRADLHERLSRWLETRAPELDELVGYHLEQAALLLAETGEEDAALADEAGGRLAEAGLRALKRFDPDAAINLLTRAGALVSDEGRRLELECELGTAFKFAGDTARAESILERAAERARERGDQRLELRARIEQAWPRLDQGAMSASGSRDLAEEAVRVFDAAGDRFGLGRAWHVAAWANGMFLGRAADASAAAERASVNYLASGMSADWSLALFAAAAWRGPTPVPSAITRCKDLLAEAGTPVWSSFVLPILAVLEAMAGRFETARAHLDEARLGRREFADASTLVTSWAENAAVVELLAGDPDAAVGILAPACDALRASGNRVWLATNSARAAEACYLLGRLDEALAFGEEALRNSIEGHVLVESLGHRVKAKALARRGRLGEAASLARGAVSLIAGTDASDDRAHALCDLAEVLALSENGSEAASALGEALTFFDLKGNVVAAERLRAGAQVGVGSHIGSPLGARQQAGGQ
jgi:DNA-binding SARP family transcriptional activator/tetratricopeptide (TPR) repeat protein